MNNVVRNHSYNYMENKSNKSSKKKRDCAHILIMKKKLKHGCILSDLSKEIGFFVV